MRNVRLIFLIAILLISVLCANYVFAGTEAIQCVAQNFIHADTERYSYEINAKRDLLSLMMAYPEYIKGVERGEDGLIYIVMQSGASILYDDKKQKSYEQKLADADIEDTLEMLYPIEDISSLMEGNFDPGRIRSYSLLREVYGASKEAIEGNLSGTGLGSGSGLFNKQNGALQALQEAFKRVSDICAADTSVYGFVYPLGGTYNYRHIAGTGRLSPHAFGIAIDLHSAPEDYWRWASRDKGQRRLDSYPRELVRAFEDCGFVWGGKWAHFDILHFEYRPEIINKAKYYKEPKFGQAWYYGFPKNEQTKRFIEIIDEAFE